MSSRWLNAHRQTDWVRVCSAVTAVMPAAVWLGTKKNGQWTSKEHEHFLWRAKEQVTTSATAVFLTKSLQKEQTALLGTLPFSQVHQPLFAYYCSLFFFIFFAFHAHTHSRTSLAFLNDYRNYMTYTAYCGGSSWHCGHSSHSVSAF